MTWTDVADNELDTDSPVTTALMTALRDNPVAIARGDSGAPRVDVSGVGVPFSAGNVRRFYDSAAYTKNGTGWSARARFILGAGGGTVRLKFDMREQSGSVGAKCFVRVKVNGSQQASWSTSNTSWVSKSVDLSVGKNKMIEVQLEGETGGTVSAIRQIELLTSGQNLFPIFAPYAGDWSFS